MIKRVGVGLFLAILLVGFAGCSGGGNATSTATVAPQIVVQNMIAQWASSNTGPSFSVDNTGKPSVISSTSADSKPLGTITYKDMSQRDWVLDVNKVEYAGSEKASVYTSYKHITATSDGLSVIFTLVKESGQWFLSEMSVTDLPSSISVEAGTISGHITDKVTEEAVAGAKVDAFQTNSQELAGSATTGDDGFYIISNLASGSYYLVINREGYDPQTIAGIVVN